MTGSSARSGSMASDPLVTIITPAYNRADFLPETMDSVLSQDYPNLEYIVLDDGSTDGTREVLRRYDGRVYWETHPNMGETRTVNKGLAMARGDVIGIVNSDDPLLPHAIATIVEFMVAHPDIGVAYPDWNLIDSGGKIIEHIDTFEYSYLDMLRWHHCFPGPATLFRKEIARALGGRDPQFRFVGDYDFWLRAGLSTRFARIPRTLATFRQHSGSASSSQTNERMAEEHLTLVRKIFSLPGVTPEMRKYRAEAYGSAYYIAGCVCRACSYPVRARYFLKALACSPWKYLGEYRKQRLTGVMLPLLLPGAHRLWRYLHRFHARLHA